MSFFALWFREDFGMPTPKHLLYLGSVVSLALFSDWVEEFGAAEEP